MVSGGPANLVNAMVTPGLSAVKRGSQAIGVIVYIINTRFGGIIYS